MFEVRLADLVIEVKFCGQNEELIFYIFDRLSKPFEAYMNQWVKGGRFSKLLPVVY